MKKTRHLTAAMLTAFACVAVADLAPVSADPTIDWTDKAVRRQAVLETAYAYYLKADCVQYGSVPLVENTVMEFCRRTKEGTPEDATPDSTYYTVCSSFTYETYFNAIGYRHSGSSDTSVTLVLTTRPQEAVVFEYDKRLDPDGSKFEPEMMRMRKLLEVGDIIVFSTITGMVSKTGKILGWGHALMYVGDVAGDGHPMVMHSGGAKYDFGTGIDQVEKGGTVRLDDMDGNFFQKGSLAKQTIIRVFRPLDLPAEQYPLTASAKARYLHPRLRIDRRVDVGPYGSVVSGSELNYSITLKNFSNKAYAVPVREQIPGGCELVSHTALPSATQSSPANTQLSWDVSLAPGEERKLEWCVRVVASAGSRVTATGGTVAGIPSNTLVTEVVPRHISAAVARAWAEANIRTATNLPACRVTGWAGGRQSREPSREVRVRDPRARHLMEGDVVVVCPSLKRPSVFKLWTMGRGGLEEMTPKGLRRVTDAEVTALLAKDFFAALRPAAETARTANVPHPVDEFVARQKAVVATAFAYHRKREFVQTAPTGAVAAAMGYVPKFGEPPDAAGPNHVIYQTPLSFVNDVYLNAIGRGFCDPAATTLADLVENPPPGMLVFAYDVRKDPDQKQYCSEMEKMWSIIEPGDVVVFMMDRSTPTKKTPPRCHAMLYVGDNLRDGHAQILHVAGGGSDVASVLGRTNGGLRKSMFDGLLHGRSANYLKKRTKIVVLRPLASSN